MMALSNENILRENDSLICRMRVEILVEVMDIDNINQAQAQPTDSNTVIIEPIRLESMMITLNQIDNVIETMQQK